MTKSRLSIVVLAGLTLILLASPPLQAGATRPILDLAPADSLVVYTAKPYSTSRNTPQAEGEPVPGTSLATILSLLNASGLIPDEGQVYADIATALPLMGEYEHALLLLDVESKRVRRPGKTPDAPPRVSLRLRRLQSAVVFRTQGQHLAVVRHLNRVVGRYTNKELAKLTTERVGDRTFRRLVDNRLPSWAVWEWGQLDDFSVVCFGKGAYERIAETYAKPSAALSHNAWFAGATKKTNGTEALAQWFIGFEHLEKRLIEVAPYRLKEVIQALGVDDVTRDLWTVAFEGRALAWRRCYQRKGEDVVHQYSDPANQPPRHRGIVPDGARHFAIIKAPTSWLVDNLPRAWLAAQSQRNSQRWRQIWEGFEQQTGIDLSESLVEHLKGNIVVFDYPPHPLDLPLAMTIAIEIDDHDAVKAASDAILAAWSQYLDERAERKDLRLARIAVKKTKDDIWHLQAAGLLGPSLKVSKRYLVISWSPEALKKALACIEASDRVDGQSSKGAKDSKPTK